MREVPLTQNRVALIDDEDWDLISQYKWSAHLAKSTKSYYAITKINGKHVSMHRLLMATGKEFFIDHKNGVTLDNRRANLRPCSREQNAANSKIAITNTSGRKGVTKHKNKWRARLRINGQCHELGCFDSIDAAGDAYDKKHIEIYGEFSYCRHPKSQELPSVICLPWDGDKNVDKGLIRLTQDQYALIDKEDYEFLSQYKWYAKWNSYTRSFYAARNITNNDGTRTTIYMHRELVKVAQGFIVDHKYGDTLDNRMVNLRVCNTAENARNKGLTILNTSNFKGVSWHKGSQKWHAQIRVNGKQIHLGYFGTPELAHEAYCEAALELHGEFARMA